MEARLKIEDCEGNLQIKLEQNVKIDRMNLR
jgi:hypothetical protein